MKLLKPSFLMLGLGLFLVLLSSCGKDDPCKGVSCVNGIANETETGCECDCTGTIYIGSDCSTPDPIQVQALLDTGTTPKSLYDDGVALEHLYGKMYEGGLIFYLNTSDGTGLVAATEDQSDEAEWGCFETEINGADGDGLGMGAENTVDIVNGCMQVGIAARLCDELDLNSKTDWFLPSKDELDLMWKNLADSDGNDKNNGPNDSGNLGGFADDSYWSSTQGGAYVDVDANINPNDFAWIQGFGIGGQSSMHKSVDVGRHVRAARAF